MVAPAETVAGRVRCKREFGAPLLRKRSRREQYERLCGDAGQEPENCKGREHRKTRRSRNLVYTANRRNCEGGRSGDHAEHGRKPKSCMLPCDQAYGDRMADGAACKEGRQDEQLEGRRFETTCTLASRREPRDSHDGQHNGHDHVRNGMTGKL